MQLKRALNLIKRNKPTNEEEFTDLGFSLEFIGSGAFRTAYKLTGLPLVVKFPQEENDTRTNKLHTTMEVKKINHFRKFKELREYLPKVHYHDQKAGIIVMEYVNEPAGSEEERLEAVRMRLSTLCGQLIKSLTRVDLGDIHEDNVRVTRHGMKFIDLAY